MKKLVSLSLALIFALSAFTACGKDGSDNPSVGDTPTDPTPTPRLYFPDPFTGEEKTADYPSGQRAVAIMVNNISACRPQSGLSEATILVESRVEGGITRFMALYQDYKNLPDVGPVRSARDQFVRLAIPYQPLYCHIGRSAITQQYIDDNDYNDLDLDGNGINFIYRRNRGAGFATEHTAYTNATELQKAIDKGGYNMERDYNSPLFNFIPYDENGGKRVLNDYDVDLINVVHSETYRTYFDYDKASDKYLMSQYSGTLRQRHKTVDENNGQQLGFENVFIVFAEITKYPYPGGNLDANGNDKGDPNYQKVDFDNGGIGYYFSGGRGEKIRWFKGPASDRLRFTDMDENDLPINIGKSYIGVVGLDQHDNFEFAEADKVIDETIDHNKAGSEVETDE